MKEINITLNAYSFDELPEDAKKNVIERYRERVASIAAESNNYEYQATLEKFCEITGVEMLGYITSEYGCSFKAKMPDTIFAEWEIPSDDEDRTEEEHTIWTEDISGKLLNRYMLNNILPEITQGKYYSVCSKEPGKMYKSRRSRITKTLEDCPLTGVCCDYDILKPILEAHKTCFMNCGTFEDLMNACLDSFFSAWHEAYEWWESDEYVEDWCAANLEDELFDEDGNEISSDILRRANDIVEF